MQASVLNDQALTVYTLFRVGKVLMAVRRPRSYRSYSPFQVDDYNRSSTKGVPFFEHFKRSDPIRLVASADVTDVAHGPLVRFFYTCSIVSTSTASPPH